LNSCGDGNDVVSVNHRQHGVVLLLLLLAILVGIGALAFSERSLKASMRERDEVTDLALKQAKEALISYAAAHVVLTTDTSNGPGYLPCPDRDDDGESDWNCGNYAGTSGQAQRLGRLPWKTLRLPDLRDSAGERLWYAVSSSYKTSALKPGLNPDTGMGTITLRDSTGTVIHDGTLGEGPLDIYHPQAGGVVAVIIAPGLPIGRIEPASGQPAMQDRSCQGGSCDPAGRCTSLPERQTAKCNPQNYLDKAVGLVFGYEDNATFVDANVGRAGNVDGFIQGPVYTEDRTLLVNDRIVAITYDDIMPALMRRVAIEAAHCLQEYVSAPAGSGTASSSSRYPFAAPACRSGYANARQWDDGPGIVFGRFPEGAFTRTAAASNNAMQDRWTTGTSNVCSISAGPSSAWFEPWKEHVFFAVAPAHKASSGLPSDCTAATCLQVVNESGELIAQDKQFAVLVSGPPMQSSSVTQSRGGSGRRSARNYFEATNAFLDNANDLSAVAECADVATSSLAMACGPPFSPCNRITVAQPSKTFNDLVLYFPP
jgi:hypothetical protein